MLVAASEVEKALKTPTKEGRDRTLSKDEVDYWMREFGIGDSPPGP